MRAGLFCAALAMVPGAAMLFAQSSGGSIDVQRQRDLEIIRLERMVGGDISARKQATTLRWLIGLYRMNGRYADVERSYYRILVFFPDDVGTLNDYAAFLLDTELHEDRADSLLQAANAWARSRQNREGRTPARGRTFTLWGRYALRIGAPEVAVRRAQRALRFLSEEDSPDALRVLVTAQRDLGLFDDAGKNALRLIGIEGATNRDDINLFLSFVSRTSLWDATSVRAAIDDAVRGAKDTRRKRARSGGGDLVEIVSDDGTPLEGTLRNAGGAPGALLIHDVGRRRSAFAPLAQLLYVDGVTTLSVDLRGHGASRSDSIPSPQTLSPRNRERLRDDIVAAWRSLASTDGVDRDRIVVIASGTSCALAEVALARVSNPPPHRVWISPVFDPLDLDLHNAFAFSRAGVRALYSDDDYVSVNAVSQSLSRYRGSIERDILHAAGHGLEVFQYDAGALSRLVAWITRVTAN